MSGASSLEAPDVALISEMGRGSRPGGRWTEQEHATFLSALQKYGRSWKVIQPLISTRSVEQVRWQSCRGACDLLRAFARPRRTPAPHARARARLARARLSGCSECVDARAGARGGAARARVEGLCDAVPPLCVMCAHAGASRARARQIRAHARKHFARMLRFGGGAGIPRPLAVTGAGHPGGGAAAVAELARRHMEARGGGGGFAFAQAAGAGLGFGDGSGGVRVPSGGGGGWTVHLVAVQQQPPPPGFALRSVSEQWPAVWAAHVSGAAAWAASGSAAPSWVVAPRGSGGAGSAWPAPAPGGFQLPPLPAR